MESNISIVLQGNDEVLYNYRLCKNEAFNFLVFFFFFFLIVKRQLIFIQIAGNILFKKNIISLFIEKKE